MASLPCKDCLTGSLHPGTPTGTESTIHNLPTYISSPPDGAAPRGLIVMIPDMYGWKMPNNRLLCDIYAQKGGWLVYLPDFMDGKCLPLNNLQTMVELTTPSTSWTHTLLTKPVLAVRALSYALPPTYTTRSAVCTPRVLEFFQKLRASPPPPQFLLPSPAAAAAAAPAPLRIGVAAFCWGGQHAVSLAQDIPAWRVPRHPSQDPSPSPDPSPDSGKTGEGGSEKRLVDCVFTAHPAFFSIPGDVEKIVVPFSVVIGDADMAVGGKSVKIMKAVLDGKNGAGKQEGGGEYECVVLEGAKHGFAVRSCVTDEVQMGYADAAERQALQWFEKWMA